MISRNLVRIFTKHAQLSNTIWCRFWFVQASLQGTMCSVKVTSELSKVDLIFRSILSLVIYFDWHGHSLWQGLSLWIATVDIVNFYTSHKKNFADSFRVSRTLILYLYILFNKTYPMAQKHLTYDPNDIWPNYQKLNHFLLQHIKTS